jgi:hypothetical protein
LQIYIEIFSSCPLPKVEVGVEAVEEKVYKADEGLNGKVSIWQGDITKLSIGAIVNAANEELERGGGGNLIAAP